LRSSKSIVKKIEKEQMRTNPNDPNG